MIWVSNGSTIKQGIPLKYNNWNDGLPFNYKSSRVYMAQEDQPSIAAFRIHPAQENGTSGGTTYFNIANVFLDYRVQGGRYSDVPAVEYSNNTWYGYSVHVDGNKCAPSIFPRSTSTGVYSPYLSRYFNNAEGSFKNSRNGIWTTTFTKDTHQHFYPSFIFYAILLITNSTTNESQQIYSPTARPDSVDMLAFSNTSDSYSSGTWISSAGTVDLTIDSSSYGFPVEADTVFINNIATKYQVYIVRNPAAFSYKADNLILNNGLSELSIPFITFKNARDGDTIYFLEYGFNISYKFYQ